MSQAMENRMEPAVPARRGGAAGKLLHRLLSALRCGALALILPDGQRIDHQTGRPGPQAVLVLHRWRALRRLALGGDIGFAEAYMEGDWSSPDLAALIELAARNRTSLPGVEGGALPLRLLRRLYHLGRRNTLAGSRRNIRQHYDLGNDFYSAWLDDGMSYSSGLFLDGEIDLADAQAAKQARILALLGLEPGQTVLEIGFGWGGLVKRMAETGCDVTGLTLSPAQLAYAQARLQVADLDRRAALRLQDYRKMTGSFDRIVSIEMLEAVGERWWPAYFAMLKRSLKPGGVVVLQTITIADARFDAYRRKVDFIQRHIFPGGMLLSPSALQAQVAAAGLAVTQVETFGESYARTLELWRERFHAAWPKIAAQGFSERFRRMWDYYLCYCEAGFRSGTIDVGLWRLEHRC